MPQQAPSQGAGRHSALQHGLARVAAVLGLQRVQGRWTVPALGSYFDEPPPRPQPGPARS